MSVPLQFLTELEIRQFLTMAAWTVLAYDYLLTFDLEMDYIWRAPWTTAKALFLLNRYGGLIGQSALMIEETGVLTHGSRQFCENFLWIQSLLVLTLSETTRALLLLRARVLWKCSYRMAVSLVSLYVIYVLLRCGYTSYVTFKNYGHFQFRYLSETKVCTLIGAVSSVWFSGVTSFVLDTIVFAVIAYYLYKLCGESQPLRHSALLRLLVRDAILFYLVNVFHDVIGILSLSVLVHGPLYLTQVVFAYPFLLVAGQRTVLNLRTFQPRSYTTEEINRSIDRQLAAIERRTFWQGVDPWMDDLHQEVMRNEERSRCGSIRPIDLRITEETQALYELEVLRAPVGPRDGAV